MVPFMVACRHALSGAAPHTVVMQGHRKDMNVGRLKEQLRYATRALHRNDICIIQGGTALP